MSLTNARRMPRFVLAAALAAMLCILAMLNGTRPAYADDTYQPTPGYDAATKTTWTQRIGSVMFGAQDNAMTCETRAGKGNGYSERLIWIATPLANRTVVFDAWVDDPDSIHQPYTAEYKDSPYTMFGTSIGNMTAGDHMVYIAWTDLNGAHQEYSWPVTITLCPEGETQPTLTFVSSTPDTDPSTTGTGTMTVRLDPGTEAAYKDVTYSIYNRDDPDYAVTKTTRLGTPVEATVKNIDGSDLAKVYIVLGYGQVSSTFIFDSVGYDDGTTEPVQALPKASVTGTSKVVVSPVARSLCVTNTKDSTKLANDYDYVLSGSASKAGTLENVKDGATACKAFSLSVGSYSVYFIGSDGTSNTVKFTVSAYPEPVFSLYSSRSAIAKATSAYPKARFGYRTVSKSGKYGKYHWTTGYRGAGTVKINAPNPKKGKTLTYDYVVDPSGTGRFHQKYTVKG